MEMYTEYLSPAFTKKTFTETAMFVILSINKVPNFTINFDSFFLEYALQN